MGDETAAVDIDTNGDGVITFDEMDTNKDHVISRNELEAALASKHKVIGHDPMRRIDSVRTLEEKTMYDDGYDGIDEVRAEHNI